MPQTNQSERIPSPTLGRELDLPPIVRPIEIRSKRPDTWKPPDTWECPSDEPPNMALPALPEAPRQQLKKRRQDAEKRKRIPADFAHLKRSIRRMEAASSKIVLERLKEEWMEATDASVYRELELEKQLWMLTALRKKIGQCSEARLEENMTGAKVLSLFENQGKNSGFHAFFFEQSPFTLPLGRYIIIDGFSLRISPLHPHQSKRGTPPLHLPLIATLIPKYPPAPNPGPNTPPSLRVKHLQIHILVLSPLFTPRIFYPANTPRMSSVSYLSLPLCSITFQLFIANLTSLCFVPRNQAGENTPHAPGSVTYPLNPRTSTPSLVGYKPND